MLKAFIERIAALWARPRSADDLARPALVDLYAQLRDELDRRGIDNALKRPFAQAGRGRYRRALARARRQARFGEGA